MVIRCYLALWFCYYVLWLSELYFQLLCLWEVVLFLPVCMHIGCDCSRYVVRHWAELNFVVGSCAVICCIFQASTHMFSSVIGSCTMILLVFQARARMFSSVVGSCLMILPSFFFQASIHSCSNPWLDHALWFPVFFMLIYTCFVVGSCIVILLTFQASTHLFSSVMGSCIMISLVFLLLFF